MVIPPVTFMTSVASVRPPFTAVFTPLISLLATQPLLMRALHAIPPVAWITPTPLRVFCGPKSTDVTGPGAATVSRSLKVMSLAAVIVARLRVNFCMVIPPNKSTVSVPPLWTAS